MLLMYSTSNHNELTFSCIVLAKLKWSVISNYNWWAFYAQLVGGQIGTIVVESPFTSWTRVSSMIGPIHSSWKYYTGLGMCVKKCSQHPCPRWQKNKDKNKTQLETTLNAEQEKTIESSVGFHTPKFHVFMKMNNAQLYLDALKTTLSETHNPDKTPHRIFYKAPKTNKTNNTLFKDSTYLDKLMWDLFWCKTQGKVDPGGRRKGLKNSFKDTLMFYSLVAQQ